MVHQSENVNHPWLIPRRGHSVVGRWPSRIRQSSEIVGYNGPSERTLGAIVTLEEVIGAILFASECG